MPCQQAGHTHVWPATGDLKPAPCENICGYCRTASRELIGATWMDWTLLFEHVYNVHLHRREGSHPRVHLRGPSAQYLPAGLDLNGPRSAETMTRRNELRRALAGAAAAAREGRRRDGEGFGLGETTGAEEKAGTGREVEAEVDDPNVAGVGRMPFTPEGIPGTLRSGK